MDLTALDATAMASLLARREVSAVELVRAHLHCIEGLEPALHCFITLTADAALAQAAESDARAGRGQRHGPLDGVPIALKDNIDVAGVPCTAGVGARRNVVAAADAEVVRRLGVAGAVLLGKLNLHEAALGATTDNTHFGRTENPHRRGYTPGGSSGGSGAAVAAGFCAAALGTDSLGSVRVPAAYCGVAGLKPTYGLVSTRRVVPLSLRLDHVGPLSRSVRDLGVLLDAIAGYDGPSPQSEPAPALTSYAVEDEPDVRGVLVGRPTWVGGVALEDDVATAWQSALDTLSSLGARIRDVEIADYEPRRARLAGLLICEADGAVVHADDLARHPDGFSAEVRAMLEYGRGARAEQLVRAERVMAQTRLAARTTMSEVDVLVLPTTPQVAFPFGTRPPDSQADLTALASLAGLPAASVPMGRSGSGLPMGLQIVGRPWAERTVLAVARAYERAAAWDMRPRTI